jgi:hypothetical protein
MNDPVLAALLSASREHEGDEPTESLRRASRAFLMRTAVDATILSAAAEALSTLPPAGAGWLAVMLGTAIERGADAQLATPALAQFYLSWLPQLPVPGMPDDDNEDAGPHFPEPTPEQAAILAALPRISQSLVSHLARMPEERERLAADAALIERLGVLGSYSHGATWMREILVRTSGSLIVLHPPSGAGLQLRY